MLIFSFINLLFCYTNNYKILTETVNGGEPVVKSDGLNNLRFRLFKRFQTVGNISLDKAEILSVQL